MDSTALDNALIAARATFLAKPSAALATAYRQAYDARIRKGGMPAVDYADVSRETSPILAQWLASPDGSADRTIRLEISGNLLVRMLNAAQSRTRETGDSETAAIIDVCRDILSAQRMARPCSYREPDDYEWKSEPESTEPFALYGVSFGNGNDGISHLYPSFYVYSNDPYRLANLAMVGQFREEFQAKALAECEVSGNSEFTVQACIYEPLDYVPEKDCDCEDDCDHEASSWCDANGAAHLVNVFEVAEDEVNSGVMEYKSIQDAFSIALLDLVK